MKSIRVLVADDSLVMRSLLRMVLASEPAIELAGMAADGMSALDAVQRINPDLILLDIEMPRMNGLEVLTELQARRNTAKVIMCSTLTRRGAGITMDALAHGAIDYVTKPTGQHGAADAVAALSMELLPKIKALFANAYSKELRSAIQESHHAGHADVVVIGVSTGGPTALETLLTELPADFPAPVVIAQHMPQVFTALLAERLNRECALKVCEASQGMCLEAGSVYIARGDWHLEFGRLPFNNCDSYGLRLSQAKNEHFCRPSVDVLFRSAAEVYRNKVIGVVLTGMGSDGLEGCKAIRHAGGRILVQDRTSSAVWGMPGVVAEAGLAHRVLSLKAIAAELIRCCPSGISTSTMRR